MKNNSLIHIDFPEALPENDPFLFQGWITSHSAVGEIWVSGKPHIPLKMVDRPDVYIANPEYPCAIGFSGMLPGHVMTDNSVILNYRSDSGEFSESIRFLERYPLSRESKKRKLKKIIPFLACPDCGRAVMHKKRFLGEHFKCESCSRRYRYRKQKIFFLSEEHRIKYKVIDSNNISSNKYDEKTISIIKQYKDGLILDCGAGNRTSDYPNVINYEIVDYPSTDIVGIAERLPFKDQTFDAVLSLSVLEHVMDPFAHAREIARVLKKGGILYGVAAFLQPEHGFPNHYYNMTAQGLKNLFADDLEILEIDVPLRGLPIWTLTWELNSWAAGLDEKSREEFLNLRIRDVMGDPRSFFRRDFVRSLSREKNFELASSIVILATRK